MKRFLIRHLGNMGDMVFFIPPVLATLKKHYPGCHITFVTVWGFKDKKGQWGKRDQGGFSIHLIMTNPHLDQLVHYHDTKLSLDGKICREDGQSFPTWNKKYYDQQKNSGRYDQVFELDFGLKVDDNPIQRMYETIGLPNETLTDYKIYFTDRDLAAAQAVIDDAPRPRIVLLEGLASTTTRGWDPGKIPALEQAIKEVYQVDPIWFGGNYIPDYQGRSLSLRENIATLSYCDAGIGVMSGPIHFAAAADLPTLTLYCDHPIHRAAPAYFLGKKHRTLLGPSTRPYQLLKNEQPAIALTPAEISRQQFKSWNQPGRQTTKTCLSVITVDEIMLVLKEMLS
ncbi:MAG: glycosyltransferase family 9 protein [bacterium]